MSQQDLSANSVLPDEAALRWEGKGNIIQDSIPDSEELLGNGLMSGYLERKGSAATHPYDY